MTDDFAQRDMLDDSACPCSSPGEWLPPDSDACKEARTGCRAKFITGSVAALLQKPGGGDEWLQSLRQAPYREAAEALTSLPGIGPKAGISAASIHAI